MADEATDVADGEITLDQFNGDEADPKAESSPAKAEAKAEKPEPKAKEEAKAEPKAEESKEVKETEDKEAPKADDTAEATEPEETEKPQGKAEERKSQLNSEIRNLVSEKNNLVAERNRLKDEVQQMTGQVYEAPKAEDLTTQINPETGQEYTRLEARQEALEQQINLDKYNTQVADAQLTLSSEAMQVLNEFPIFNPDSDQFDEELRDEAADLLEANLIRDPNVPELDPATGQPTGKGLIIGSNVSPYKLYKTLARANGISQTKGELKGQQNAEEMLANTDAASSNAPPSKPKDPLMELWTSDD